MTNKKIGIAGLGAIGSAVAKALIDGIPGLELVAASDSNPARALPGIPLVDFSELARRCDLVVECLPAGAVAALTKEVINQGKTIIIISSAALLTYPEILDHARVTAPKTHGRILVPSGSIAGVDGVHALSCAGIKTASIASTKKPAGYEGAPYIIENQIDLAAIKQKQKLFSGTAREAAKAFPANVNVAATLSLAGIGPDRTTVEVWADPDVKGNTHEITVQGEFSTITSRVQNMPDPMNPKTSMLAALSIIAALKNLSEPIVIL